MIYLTLLKKFWPFAAVAALLIAMWGYGFYKERLGKLKCQQAFQEAIHQEREKQADLALQLETAKNNRQVQVREKIKIVKEAVENTECGNVHLPDVLVDSLRVPDSLR